MIWRICLAYDMTHVTHISHYVIMIIYIVWQLYIILCYIVWQDCAAYFSYIVYRWSSFHSINGKWNYWVNHVGLELMKWTKIDLSHYKIRTDVYNYTIRIDDQIIHQVTDFSSQVFKNIDVWAGDKTFALANARIRNLKVETTGRVVHFGIF